MTKKNAIELEFARKKVSKEISFFHQIGLWAHEKFGLKCNFSLHQWPMRGREVALELFDREERHRVGICKKKGL
ncbi:unnamed protein product [Linum trigynum]|uniref:Uncharacterized protein n=1 Tax=Linum trigynum TaxID=586398 RepID=A0AAV2FJG6_9ROSI